MKVTHILCNPAATQSELDAVNALKSGLIALRGSGEWILLTNLTFSVTHRLQSEEIDLVAVGPPGVRVIEVKHWINSSREIAESEADRLTMKARRIGTRLRREVPGLPHVEASVLLTPSQSDISTSIRNEHIRGVRYCTVSDWCAAVGADGREALAAHEVERIAQLLGPQSDVPVDASLRRLGGYVNLELIAERGNGAHRIYRGIHSTTRDRVVLHLYDHSAPGSQATAAQARCHHDTLRSLQLCPWCPRVLHSLRYVPGYRGELSFFTVLDPGAPTLRARSSDPTWDVAARLDFARAAVAAVAHLLDPAGACGTPPRGGVSPERIVQRNLSPDTIVVTYHNSPVITGLGLLEASHGSGAATSGRWSDAHALCEALASLFSESGDDLQAKAALNLLFQGQMEVLEAKEYLDALARSLSQLTGKSPATPPVPSSRYWSEGQEVSFRGRNYRVVAPLGRGGSWTTYKVVELDPRSGEETGTFVAKVAHDQQHGDRIRVGHQLVRAAARRHAGLSTVIDVADIWKNNEFSALMTWIEGAPLSDFVGLLPLLAEEYDREPQELAMDWLRAMVEALDVLHRGGMVHGGVSPRNIIVDGQDLVLTDYDCVSRVGDPMVTLGPTPYCSPLPLAGEGASPGDDLRALAASLFHVLFDRVPFAPAVGSLRRFTLDWRDEDRDRYPDLVEFLDRATESRSKRRFSSAAEALKSLPTPGPALPDGEQVGSGPPVPPRLGSQRGPHEVPWLRQLLTSYPGSRYGNTETRGLDTTFAWATYIETDLEGDLLDQISEGRISLVVLCGNAGDGKTALLQYLADGLGIGCHTSSQRIVDELLEDGTRVRINLDGSAAYRGRSADEILDDFLEPFRNGPPTGSRLVHLLAVNDGRLLEWIHRHPTGTPLKKTLLCFLGGSDSKIQRANPHIAFHYLNRRSRVGRVTEGKITTRFLDGLLRQLYGGDDAGKTWSTCRTCYAQERCRVFEATRVFGPEDVPKRASTAERTRARQRLFDALQAVHFRGETHITVRELRAALVYILFGTRYCQDYHDGTADHEPAYWDRAFSAESPRRQGEVLRELLRLDPALEAHPKVDRRLLRESGIAFRKSDSATLASQRRRAYFEWTDSRIRTITGDETHKSLGLARGRSLTDFQNIPVLDDEARQELCQKLCQGIARIGDLPELALEREGVVPLRITPRTPTETAFWTEKPFDRFRLDLDSDDDLGHAAQGGFGTTTERELHREAQLVYEYEDGRQERLPMSADLFHRLLRMSEGYQLADISMDDTFARLSIFLQRIAREGDQDMMAWNPVRDESMFRISIDHAGAGEADAKQTVAIRAVDARGTIE